jgi:hypothetical protein
MRTVILETRFINNQCILYSYSILQRSRAKFAAKYNLSLVCLAGMYYSCCG